jgi:aspartate carbamoyltransferase catalytic subunit
MKFHLQNILSTAQFDRSGLEELFDFAFRLEKAFSEGGSSSVMSGKVMASLFFEPSTRTRFSFETAMIKLGGGVVSNFDMMNTSSLKKRESLRDTGKVVSKMVDVIVIRHPEAGSVDEIALGSECPVINAGDGSAQHPTQALLDLYTIWKEKGRLDGLTVGMIGDLKNGRVPHSQCDLLKHFNVKFVFVSPKELKMPEGVVSGLLKEGREIVETENLNEVISDLDVIAMTRIQEERFSSNEVFKKYFGFYVLNDGLMKIAKKDSIIIHPLPRVDEISVEVDDDPRAKYFEQVKNGVFVRMALLCKVFGVEI